MLESVILICAQRVHGKPVIATLIGKSMRISSNALKVLGNHGYKKFKIPFVSALDAVPELVRLLPDVKTTNDIIKKPVALDDFIMAVKNVLDH